MLVLLLRLHLSAALEVQSLLTVPNTLLTTFTLTTSLFNNSVRLTSFTLTVSLFNN